MHNRMNSDFSTPTCTFDTFHGIRNHKKKKKKDAPRMVGSQKDEHIVSTSCLKAEKKKTKINYKSGGRHWVMDSGCSQYMTGNSRIFTTLEEGDHDREHTTLGDNSKKKV